MSTSEDKDTRAPIATGGRARQYWHQLKGNKRAQVIEGDTRGPTVVRVKGTVVTTWRRVSGSGLDAAFEMEGES